MKKSVKGMSDYGTRCACTFRYLLMSRMFKLFISFTVFIALIYVKLSDFSACLHYLATIWLRDFNDIR
jgi:hypothetical protein